MTVGLVLVGVVGVGEQSRLVCAAAVVTTIAGAGLVAATGSQLVYIALLTALGVCLWAVPRWRWMLSTLTLVEAAVIVVVHRRHVGSNMPG
ncbi:MAG: hypothetical protein Q4B98_06330 [Cutibacterium sp.]|nr:hypothetical protein [Cutibacterium sp.]MDO4412650.1 hypothetical protein [Cutibacterium sp.]